MLYRIAKPFFRRTVASDLIIGLTVSIGAVFLLATSLNYWYSTERDARAIGDKAEEIMDNLSSVLVTPMWNLNMEEVERIVEVYQHSDIIDQITVLGEDGFNTTSTSADLPKALIMQRDVLFENTKIGSVSVVFSDASYSAQQAEILFYTLFIFLIVALTLAITTVILLRRFLSEPFSTLTRGLEVIASGDYSHRLPLLSQLDLNTVSQKINLMAFEISRRQQDIAANRDKLETLNQAIMDMFSSSDTSDLISVSLKLTHRICGVTHGVFVATTDTTSPESEHGSIPPTVVCVNGEHALINDTSTKLPDPSQDKPYHFRFKVSSHQREVGTFWLAFDNTPDPATLSLLKSLMSLVNMSMSRQSFIRETAFISAELQVAEAVQRSMLDDGSCRRSHAHVSYHFQPVLRVGGDWFSLIEANDGKSLYVILGDVTGHGLAQGLITTAMAGALSVIESLIHESDSERVVSPAHIVSHLNNVITKVGGTSNLGMTCVAARFDFSGNELYVCNAGHTFPLIIRQGSGDANAAPLTRHQQQMLGSLDSESLEAPYVDAKYKINRDDIFVFYTDGLTEAENRKGQVFQRRFLREISKLPQGPDVNQVRDHIVERLREHVAEVPIRDDVCLLVIKNSIDPQSTVAA